VVAEEWRTSHNEQSYIICMLQLNRLKVLTVINLRWVRRVACIKEGYGVFQLERHLKVR
jgi:hypothetical protein